MSVKVVHKREPHDFYIGRPSILGNPFSHIADRHTLAKYIVSTRQDAINRWEEYAWYRMLSDVPFREAILACDGKTVGCWCKPKACHGDRIERLIARWRVYENDLANAQYSLPSFVLKP